MNSISHARLCVFGGLFVDMWRLVHQWSFLLFDCFWRLVHCWYTVVSFDIFCNVARVSCNVARVSCNITGNTCNITRNTCNITGNTCTITRNTCMQHHTKHLQHYRKHVQHYTNYVQHYKCQMKQQCTNSVQIVKNSQTAKMTIGVPIVTCLHRVRRIHKAVMHIRNLFCYTY